MALIIHLMKNISAPPFGTRTALQFDAIEMDDEFLERLHASSWRVHSTFKRTINLISNENNLITLATSENSLMPYSLTTSAQDFTCFKDLVDETVHVIGNELLIGDALCICLNKGKVGSTLLHVQSSPKDHACFLENVQFFADCFKSKHALGSFFLSNSASSFEKALQEQLVLKAKAFCEAIASDNDAQAIAHGQSLMGLGIGLTPSGDDYLVGFFAVMFSDPNKCKSFEKIATGIVKAAPNYTNIISATYLQSAARQRLKTEIHNLVQSVYVCKKPDIECYLNQLLKIGSTSGTDIAKGMLDAFFLYKVAAFYPK